MSSHSMKVLVPPVVEMPRGARWAAEAAAWIVRAFASHRHDRARTPGIRPLSMKAGQ